MKRMLSLNFDEREQDRSNEIKRTTKFPVKKPTLGLTPIMEVLADLELSTSKKGSKDDFNLGDAVASKRQDLFLNDQCPNDGVRKELMGLFNEKGFEESGMILGK